METEEGREIVLLRRVKAVMECLFSARSWERIWWPMLPVAFYDSQVSVWM